MKHLTRPAGWALKWLIFIFLMVFAVTMAAEAIVLLTMQEPHFGANWAAYDTDKRLQEMVRLSPLRIQVGNALCKIVPLAVERPLNCVDALEEITK